MDALSDLSVLVTGGSRGLGLLLARQCVERRCDVTVAARDQEELDHAVGLLRRRTRDNTVTGRVCDVTDREAVRELVERTAADQRGLDVVLANAGNIQVGPAEEAGTKAFRSAMDTMFFGALHTSMETLPHLRESPAGGRLGLIGSVGGLLPVPHLLPYSCAKSAVAALAEGLRAEVAEDGVSVTGVHPGLMRTGSHNQVELTGDKGKEYAWFATLAGLPGLSMDALRAAERIVHAVEQRRTRVVLTPAAQLGAKAYGMAPTLVTRTNELVARLMPGPQPSGRQGRSRWQSTVSALNDRAARRLNQT
ncbi:SDR family NAD(P)-dependent oxidoreductase [Streptomyces tubbatahanensis]|uniref:SDR family NAD(P)-dependent oxidoreductase n=1 Tax=Streptomyces tubbatahanensis TaxID=2923272 RepID=A0ABY3XZN5_9ACTN|nr:SDR family NAD(P)-dependent oxidoreductase [Streptomyces tubbatahanensis]UNS99949.1 SDR family NAD(P)-dependent oxidoreductase [Streptomyces tubbatahanensis]